MKKYVCFLAVILAFLIPQAVFAVPFAYITNTDSNTVSVIDTDTNRVIATIPVGISPWGIAVNPGGARAYVTNEYSDDVSVIDTTTNTVLTTIPLGSGPNLAAINSAGTRVYVTTTVFGGTTIEGYLAIINTESNSVTSVPLGETYPKAVTVNPTGTRVYISRLSDIAVIDTASNSVVATVPISSPQGIVVHPDATKLYVADDLNGEIKVINTTTNTVADTISGIESAYGVGISPDGTKLYAVSDRLKKVFVVETSTNTVIKSVSVGKMPGGISVTPNGQEIYVSNSESKNVSVIDARTNKVIKTVKVGKYPDPLGQFVGGVGAVNLTTPNGDELWETDVPETIEWTAFSPAEKFQVFYSLNDGKAWQQIGSGFTTETTLNGTIPSLTKNQTKCRVKVIGYDASDNVVGSDISDSAFGIQMANVTFPNGGESFVAEALTAITWQVKNTKSPVVKAVLSYTLNGGGSWKNIETLEGSYPAGEYDRPWTVPALGTTEKTKCMVKVTLKDVKGATVGSDISDGYFTISPAP